MASLWISEANDEKLLKPCTAATTTNAPSTQNSYEVFAYLFAYALEPIN